MKKALLFLVCVTLAATPAMAAKARNPFVTVAEGDVTLKPDTGSLWEPLAVGRVLEALDTIRTGQESRAELNAPSGTIRLYQNTVITLPEVFETTSETTDIQSPNVEEGTGIFKIRWKGRKNRFNVTTKHIVAVVKGTTFAVRRRDKESTVACIGGKVTVSAQDKTVTERVIHLGPGKMVTFTEGIGFGKVLDFNPDIYIWNFWEDDFELDLEVKGDTAMSSDIEFGGAEEGCPPDDILW